MILSSIFKDGEKIASKYTCDDQDISPALTWEGVPDKTQSLVLIMDDPDAPKGTWDHWILFNMPADTRSLPENVKQLPAGTLEGVNSWGKTGYGGPCPPNGVHRYLFKLYALDCQLSLKTGVDKHSIENAMKGHILAQSTLMGKYTRL